jgi:hypothetical protein
MVRSALLALCAILLLVLSVEAKKKKDLEKITSKASIQDAPSRLVSENVRILTAMNRF